MEDIDNISKMMQRMEDADVTVLWRPLHEASGGWFWWGASGPEAYTSLDMMEKVYNSDVMITRDELPDFSKYNSNKN